MDTPTLFDVLFEKWKVADQAANDAWARLNAPHRKTSNFGDDLITAMRLQVEAAELLAALRAELGNERRQIPVI
jgi:hypothetical protein